MLGFDIIVGLVLLVMTVRGAFRGFIMQMATLVSLIGSYFVARAFADPVANELPLPQPLATWAAMVLLYVVVSLCVFFAASRLRKFVESVRLKEYDRHLGMLFGFGNGAVICLVLTAAGVLISDTTAKPIAASHSGQFGLQVLKQLGPALPQRFRSLLDPGSQTAAATRPARKFAIPERFTNEGRPATGNVRTEDVRAKDAADRKLISMSKSITERPSLEEVVRNLDRIQQTLQEIRATNLQTFH